MSVCNAILRHPDGERFVMCELENGHEGYHKGLCYEWKGMDEVGDLTDWSRGEQLFKMNVERICKGVLK